MLTHRPSRALSFAIVAAALLGFAISPASSQDPESPPTGREGPPVESEDTPDVHEEKADEDQEEEGEKKTEEKETWLSKWGRFRSSLRDITEMDYKDGMLRGRFGFRMQLDAAAGYQSQNLEDRVGGIDDGLNIRRLRLFADGDFARRFHYRFEYDFGEDDGLKDAFVDDLFRAIFKFFALRVGNIQEPFSLDNVGSSNSNAFMENSLPDATIGPGHNFGYLLHGQHRKGRVQWAFGMFTNTQTTQDNQSTSDFTMTARSSGLPIYKQRGRRLLHVGVSLSLRSPKNNTVRYESRPESRWAPFYIDTGDLAASGNRLGGVELAVIHDSHWLQAEYMEARPDTDDFGRLRFEGAYVEYGYFLTGDVRHYFTGDGTIGRLTPDRPYVRGGNPFKKGSNGGALEVAVRLSNMDLDDGAVQGGEMTDLTLGMNWYLTRATRFQFNYIYADVHSGGGHSNIFQIRYQFNPGYHWPVLHPKRKSVWSKSGQ